MFYSGYTPDYGAHESVNASLNGHVGPGGATTAPGPAVAGTVAAAAGLAATPSSSLFSQNELQAFDGFLNWQLHPQSQVQPAPASFTPYARPSAPPPPSVNYGYYPSSGSMQASTFKQGYANAPSVASDASERVETAEQRDSRLRHQASDLALWLSQHSPNRHDQPSAVGQQVSELARRPSAPAGLVSHPAYESPRLSQSPQRQSFSSLPTQSPPVPAGIAIAEGSMPLVLQDKFRRPNLPAGHPNFAPSYPATTTTPFVASPAQRRKSQDMLGSAELEAVSNAMAGPSQPSLAKRQRQSPTGEVQALHYQSEQLQQQPDTSMHEDDHEGDPSSKPNGATSRGRGKAKASAGTKKVKAGKRTTSASTATVSVIRTNKGKAKKGPDEDEADPDFEPDFSAPSALPQSGARARDSPIAARSTSVQKSTSISKGEGGGPKVALTEEQKRANHIASEQKRRTAIRSAYDELCNVVPSLRAAVKEYEERLNKVHGSAAVTDTVAGALTGGIEIGGEKVDGRAGPKSEAVVLGKGELASTIRVT